MGETRSYAMQGRRVTRVRNPEFLSGMKEPAGLPGRIFAAGPSHPTSPQLA